MCAGILFLCARLAVLCETVIAGCAHSSVDTNGNVIQGLNVLVKETGQTGVTNSKGLSIIYLNAGTYTLVLSNEKYIEMTMTVKVIRGSNTVKAEMSPAFVIPAVNTQPVNN